MDNQEQIRQFCYGRVLSIEDDDIFFKLEDSDNRIGKASASSLGFPKAALLDFFPLGRTLKLELFRQTSGEFIIVKPQIKSPFYHYIKDMKNDASLSDGLFGHGKIIQIIPQEDGKATLYQIEPVPYVVVSAELEGEDQKRITCIGQEVNFQLIDVDLINLCILGSIFV